MTTSFTLLFTCFQRVQKDRLLVDGASTGPLGNKFPHLSPCLARVKVGLLTRKRLIEVRAAVNRIHFDSFRFDSRNLLELTSDRSIPQNALPTVADTGLLRVVARVVELGVVL